MNDYANKQFAAIESRVRQRKFAIPAQTRADLLADSPTTRGTNKMWEHTIFT